MTFAYVQGEDAKVSQTAILLEEGKKKWIFFFNIFIGV